MPRAEPRRPRHASGVCALALAVLAAACGPARPNKAEFIAKGDRLCRRFDQRSRSVQLKSDPFQPGASPADLQATPAFLDFFARSLPQLAGDLRGLQPPPQNRVLLNETLRTLDRSGKEFADAKRAFEAGDPTTAKQTLDRAFGSLEQAARSAQEYGFKECGSPAGDHAAAGQALSGPEVAVTATEYAFALPADIPPGPHTLVIQNHGRERHFLTLVRLKGGVTVQRLLDTEKVGESTADLIEQNLGQSETALPGKTVRFNAELAPGDYAYACFIAAPDGQLHAYKGMAGQISVKPQP